MTDAIRKYVAFHQKDPRKVGAFQPGCVIPEAVICVGHAEDVLYRSDKLNPTTGEDEGWIDYIHDHKRGVNVCLTDLGSPGERRPVPAFIRNVRELYWLGDCLGFSFRSSDGELIKAEGTEPLPELYAIPSGKALLVIQSKRRVLAIIWGGALGIEPRGIVN